MKRNIIKANARTEIYTQLYGKQEHTYERRGHRRVNLPEIDPSRRLSTFWSYQFAQDVWSLYHRAAEFSPQREAMLKERLESLKRYKHREVAE